MNQTNKTLATVLFIAFLDMLGIGILIPVIPMLFAEPASPYFVVASSGLADKAYLFFGMLLAAYPFAQFFAAPILGQLSDKFGRRKILISSQIGTCIGYILFAIGVLTKNLPLLFVSRILDGITGGNIAVAQAALADVTPPQARARTFGMMGAVFGLGFIVGPFLGGILSSSSLVSWFNPSTPFFFAAISSALSVLATFFVLKETHAGIRRDLKLDISKSVHNIVRGFSLPNLKMLFVVSFLFQSGFSFFTTFFSVYLIDKFKIDQAQLGALFGFIGVCIIFTQAFITRTLSHYVSEVRVLKYALFGCGFAVLLHFIPVAMWQIYLVVPFFAFNNGLIQSNLIGLVSRRAGAEIQGEVMGINASMQALANTIPPLLSGLLATSFNPAAPILVASIVVITSGIVFVSTTKETARPA